MVFLDHISHRVGTICGITDAIDNPDTGECHLSVRYLDISPCVDHDLPGASVPETEQDTQDAE